MIVGVLFVYIVFLFCFILMRISDKRRNPKYSFLDDFLLFTGCPLFFAYFLYVAFNPNNGDKMVHDLFSTPLIFGLMGWMVISTILYVIRNQRNDKK